MKMLVRSFNKIHCILKNNRQFCSVHAKIKNQVRNNNYKDDLSPPDITAIQLNLKLRNFDYDIKSLVSLLNNLQTPNENADDRISILKEIQKEILKLPNKCHKDILSYGDSPKVLRTYNVLPKFNFEPLSFAHLAHKLNLIRTDHLGNFTGHKSYYLLNELAEMEHALITYTLNELKSRKFKIISVPDILPVEVIQSCGMQTEGERTQVYKLIPSGKCLSGTAEMALGGYFKDKQFEETELPTKVCAVSRCYRAETSGLQEEKGIYRVHQFTKVEMFSICSENNSDKLLDEFRDIEIDIFKKLNLHFQLLDMPPCELGNPAYRKYDIEAWMPGRKMWGEISSCSNCTDYQAKRLNITYRRFKDDSEIRHVHTINGTACAIPRMLIALLESNQEENGRIKIPQALQLYMNGKTEIAKKKCLPELKLTKHLHPPR